MKKLKKALSLTLALALSLALVVPVSAANPVTLSEENVTVMFTDVISYEDVRVCFPDLEGDDPDTYYLYCTDIRIYHFPSSGIKTTLYNDRINPTSELDMVYEGYLLDPDYMAWVYLNDDDEEMSEVRVPYPACVPLAQIADADDIYGQVNSKPVRKGELSGELTLNVPTDLGKIISLSLYVSEHDEFGNSGRSPALTVYCAFDDGKFSYKDNAIVKNPTTPVQPEQPAGPKVSDWAKDQVAKASAKGLVPDGLGDNYQLNATRAQFAAIAVKLYETMSGKTAPAAKENPFSDTNDPAILQAAELNFVSGMGDGTFAPDTLVTREQAAVILSQVHLRTGGSIGVQRSTFADSDSISGWAKVYVTFMNSKGIVTGVGNNIFNPQGNASIEQALSISLRMLENLK